MELDKLRTKRSILKRTKKRDDLPKYALYLEWLGGTQQRKVLDEEQNEHVIDDKVLLSYYKLVSGKEAKKLLEAHWPSAAAEKGQPAKA